MESAATAVTEAGARTEAEGRRDGEGTERARRRKENSGEGRTEGRASDGGSERELHGQYLWAQLGSAASEQVRAHMHERYDDRRSLCSLLLSPSRRMYCAPIGGGWNLPQRPAATRL